VLTRFKVKVLLWMARMWKLMDEWWIRVGVECRAVLSGGYGGVRWSW
jgi:hypothetical protein